MKIIMFNENKLIYDRVNDFLFLCKTNDFQNVDIKSMPFQDFDVKQMNFPDFNIKQTIFMILSQKQMDVVDLCIKSICFRFLF